MGLDVFDDEPGSRRRLPAHSDYSKYAVPAQVERVADSVRKRLLDDRVRENIVRGGARVDSRSDSEAVLVQGRRPNHVLHLLLTIVTFGVWLFVWIGVAIWSGE